MATVVVHRPRKYTVTRAAAGGRTVARFGVAGPAGVEAPKKFQITLAAPTTRDIPWVSGPITLRTLTLCTASGVSDDVTVSVNGAVVDGWENLTNDDTPTTFPAVTPVSLANGDVLRVASVSGGTDLSLGFSE